MVRLMVVLLFSLSCIVNAKQLDNTNVYTVPQNEQWIIKHIERNPCSVCTSDIYIKNGGANINGVWVYGDFELTINNSDDKVIIDTGTMFNFGDVVKSGDVEKIINNN